MLQESCLAELIGVELDKLYDYFTQQEKHIDSFMKSITDRIVLKDDGTLMLLDEDTFLRVEEGLFEKISGVNTYRKLHRQFVVPLLSKGQYVNLAEVESSVLDDTEYEKSEKVEGIVLEKAECESHRKSKNKKHNINLVEGKYAKLEEGEYKKLADGKYVESKNKAYERLNGKVYRKIENGDYIKVEDDLYRQFDGSSTFLQLHEGYLVKLSDGTYRKYEGILNGKESPDGIVQINDDDTFVLSRGGKAKYPVQLGEGTVGLFAIQQKYGSCEKVTDSAGVARVFKTVPVREMPKSENKESLKIRV